MENHPEPPLKLMLEVVRTAREIMPYMSIQVPPNLNPKSLEALIKAGANDLGGISPVTKDYINPEAEWPKIKELKKTLHRLGFTLRERLPIYPRFIQKKWYPKRLESLIERYSDLEGLVKWN